MSVNRNAGLTQAEAKVLSLVDVGLSNQQIAGALCVTVGTVKCHLHRAFEKLEARNRIEAIVKARAQGAFLRPENVSPVPSAEQH